MPRDARRAFHWATTLVFATGLSVWSCSNTNKEQLQASQLAKGCTLASDCRNPLVCVFQLCHDECATTNDCLVKYGANSGARCVSAGKDASGAAGGGGAGSDVKGGVCTFPKSVVAANKGKTGIDTSCTVKADCPGAEVCGPDGQCRDGCISNGDCVGMQECISGVCADKSEAGTITALTGGAGQSNGTGGTSHGTGGTGGTGGKGGGGGTGDTSPGGVSGEVGGAAGASPGPLVNECPDTGTTNPVEHDGETISSPQTWSGLHHVTGYLEVTAALSLKPCAVVKFDSGAYVQVTSNGSIKAVGQPTSPVVFSSDKTAPKKGDWDGIDIRADASNDSNFENVIIEYAGSNAPAITLEANAAAAFQNLLVRNTADDRCAIELNAGSQPGTFASVQTQTSKTGLCVGSDVVGSIGSFTSDAPISVATTELMSDAIWNDFGTPYVLDGTQYVYAELKLEAGVILKMPANAGINVDNNGALITEGTTAKPVTITSAKNSPAAGDWYEISFGANASNNNMLTNAVIQYGGGNSYASIDVANGSSAGFSGVTVSNSSPNECAIRIESGADVTAFDSVTFKNDGCPLYISANQIGSLGSFTADAGAISVGTDYVTKAVTWKNFGIPYQPDGSLTIQAAVDLDPGVEIQMPHGTQISVNTNGAIHANGTSKAPVLFDSAVTGPSPGEWNYIYIDSNAAGTSKFVYTEIEYAGGYSGNGAVYINDRSVEFDHCSFKNNDGCDYYVTTGGKFVDGGGNSTDNTMSTGGAPYACN
jgi:hypothetical protein